MDGNAHNRAAVAKGRTMSGLVIWEGASRLDGAPVAAIATGLDGSSANPKTGPMAQVWILRADVHPVAAAREGADASICGDCELRPLLAEKGAPRCYVNKGFGPASVYVAYRRGAYPRGTARELAEVCAARELPIRVGAYGDPGAVPTDVWRALGDSPRTGYTHQWRRRPSLRSLAMASADSVEDATAAQSQGWRTFRVRTSAADPLLPSEIACPASDEGGKRTQCASCKLCDGAREGDRRKSIAIIDHNPWTSVQASEKRRRTIEERNAR
jgi:hypothetical protein